MMDSNFAALQQLHSSLRVAIYCRLTKDDNLDGESASIHNQRDMLETWCQEHGYTVVGVYADDGWSGTNFERPAFQAMMDDVKAGKIDCIVVKDLSRFGRNYLDAGEYIEKIFPFFVIRFSRSMTITTA